jgi:uncharacterized iron-regulated membrane protein
MRRRIDGRKGGPLRTFVSSPRDVSLRWWMFYVHLITGIAFGLYFAVIGLTGSIVVFEPELSRLTMPPAALRPASADPLPLNTIVERVETAFPGRTISLVRWHPEPADRYLISLKAKDAGEIDEYVYMDRATGQILGMRPNWIRWMVELHVYLLTGKRGLQVNGIGALLLVIVSLTGIVVWWPGIRKWARGFKINLRANWRGLNYDAHRVVGVFSLVVLVVLGVTGFYFGFPEPFQRAVNYRVIPTSVVRNDLPPLDLDALVARADAALPGGLVTVLYPPATPTDPYRFRVKLPGDNWHFGRSEVYLDRYTGEVRGVHDIRKLSVAQLVFVQWMAPIHYGRFGGLATRILWLVAGLTPLVLFVSGCLMWWNRSLVKSWRRRAAQRPAPRSQQAPHSDLPESVHGNS